MAITHGHKVVTRGPDKPIISRRFTIVSKSRGNSGNATWSRGVISGRGELSRFHDEQRRMVGWCRSVLVSVTSGRCLPFIYPPGKLAGLMTPESSRIKFHTAIIYIYTHTHIYIYVCIYIYIYIYIFVDEPWQGSRSFIGIHPIRVTLAIQF